MGNIQEQIRQVENKIGDLKIKLMVEEGVLKRLLPKHKSLQTVVTHKNRPPHGLCL